MLRKFVALGLVDLFLVMSFVVAEDSIGQYNPIADVNRDGVVDILDLAEVGQAYGSNYTLIHQANKTTISVLSFENGNFSFVENSLVTVFPQGESQHGQWKYTNSSGMVTFELTANSNYIAIGWSEDRSAYNYANFTTNSLGEASVTIWLDYYSESSPIRSIPKGWLVMTFLNGTTGEPYTTVDVIFSWGVGTYNTTSDQWFMPDYGNWYFDAGQTGIFAIDTTKYSQNHPTCPYTRPNLTFKLKFQYPDPSTTLCYSIIHTDEYGGAYVVQVIDYK